MAGLHSSLATLGRSCFFDISSFYRLPTASLCSGCCGKHAPPPGWLRNSRNLLPPVLEAGRPRSGASVVSGEAPCGLQPRTSSHVEGAGSSAGSRLPGCQSPWGAEGGEGSASEPHVARSARPSTIALGGWGLHVRILRGHTPHACGLPKGHTPHACRRGTRVPRLMPLSTFKTRLPITPTSPLRFELSSCSCSTVRTLLMALGPPG